MLIKNDYINLTNIKMVRLRDIRLSDKCTKLYTFNIIFNDKSEAYFERIEEEEYFKLLKKLEKVSDGNE